MKLESYRTAADQLESRKEMYVAKVDGADYAKNDVLVKHWVHNLSTNAVVAGTEIWTNTSQGGAQLAAAPAAADIGASVTDAILGSESLVVTAGAAVALAAIPAGANHALIQVQDADIRFTRSGTAPTAASGYLQGAGQYFELDSPEEIAGFQAIALTTDATLYVEYDCEEDGINDVN